MRICAVLPAAGRGSRLGLEVPKLLAPICGSDTVLTLLVHKLRQVADHIHIVVAPASRALIERALKAIEWDAGEGGTIPSTSIGVQPQPIGMGDAVFRGRRAWLRAQTLLIVWGDQIHVSEQTLHRALARHNGVPRRIVLPLVEVAKPYVAYRFDERGRLVGVLQAREGDPCPPVGCGDVGAFVVSATGLAEAWQQYRGRQPLGARTRELNFLPFLVHLAQAGWEVIPVAVTDPLEARGINTPDDLEFFRGLYRY